MRFSIYAAEQRSEIAEIIDKPCPADECACCLNDLRQVNRILAAYRPTLSWLRQFSGDYQRPLTVLDVACGAGDMLHRIEAESRLRHIEVRLMGIDSNPWAVEEARRCGKADSKIEWFCSDVFDFNVVSGVDLIISSLFTHHLADDQIVRLLRWMEKTAVKGWLINDLERSITSYIGFKMLARLAHWHPYVQHDGPISILRSFTRDDWKEYLEQAGPEMLKATIFSSFPGRLCVSRVK